MESKIAVIGEKESVLGFRAVGFDVYEVSLPQNAVTIIDRLYEQGYGIIFITESMLAPIAGDIEKYRDNTLPAIIPIPGKNGSLGLGMSQVRKSVERAVGADILFKEE